MTLRIALSLGKPSKNEIQQPNNYKKGIWVCLKKPKNLKQPYVKTDR